MWSAVRHAPAAGSAHPQTAATYLCSPPLVVAYALAGTVDIDFATEPIQTTSSGEPPRPPPLSQTPPPLGVCPNLAGGAWRPVYLRDLWPSDAEVADHVARFVQPELFRQVYATMAEGTRPALLLLPPSPQPSAMRTNPVALHTDSGITVVVMVIRQRLTSPRLAPKACVDPYHTSERKEEKKLWCEKKDAEKQPEEEGD